jgi:DNA-binding transcriptional ArsR family regulator
MSLDRLESGAVLAALATRPDVPDGTDGQVITTLVCDRATEAAAFLKALSHEGRLMILCHLAVQERSVTELETLLGVRQAAVSQQLARLRLESLVSTRRDGKAIYYRIADPKVRQQIHLLQDLFDVAK